MYFRAIIGPAKPGSSENHGLVAVEKDSVFDVPAHGAGENYLFQVAAFANEILDGIAVGNTDDVLFNDGTIVQNFGDVVAGCANQLDTTFESLMVRACADEGRQK